MEAKADRVSVNDPMETTDAHVLVNDMIDDLSSSQRDTGDAEGSEDAETRRERRYVCF